MSLQTRLGDLITAIGADYKAKKTGYNSPAGGNYSIAPNILTTGAGAVPSGQATFWPIDVGPKGLTIQSLTCYVTTYRVGGTGVVEKLGLYADDGSGGHPLVTAPGLLYSGTISLATSIGLKHMNVSATLAHGRYWACFFYYASGAPSTAPLCTCSTNGTSLWMGSSLFGTVTRYLRIQNLTDLPTGGQAATPGADSLGAVVALRAA